MLKKILIVTLILGSFLLLPFNDIVSAGVTYTQTFEEQVNGADFSITLDPNHFMSSKEMTSVHKVSTSGKRTGLLGFYTETSTGYWNFTYSTSQYLTNFTMYYAHVDNAHSYLKFYNHTLGVGTPIIYLDFVSQTTYFLENGIPNQLDTGWTNNVFYYMTWNIDTDNGVCTYKHNTVSETGFVNSATSISDGYRIDRLYIQDLSAGKYDDITYILGSAYGETETDLFGCIDTSDLSNYGNQPSIINTHLDYQHPYIAFCTGSPVTLTPEFFELYVGSAQLEINDDIDTYQLYINGFYMGTASCIGGYSGDTWRIQWNISSLGEITNQDLIFELVCEGDPPSYWNLAVDNYIGEMGPFPQNYYVYYSNTNKINGVLDETNLYGYAPSWRIYYSDFGEDSGGNPNYVNDITLIGFQPSHPTWEIPFTYVYNTVFFDVFSNTSDGSYALWVFDENGDPVGFTQGYPITIYDYNKVYGWTPYDEGNYTVQLVDGAETLVTRSFNVTAVDVSYALWTFPNPSYQGSTYNVAVYINETYEQYENYSIMGFSKTTDANNPDKAYQTIMVGTLINEGWSTLVYNMVIGGPDYWRLFGTNNDGETWYPVTQIYTHYKYLSYQSYIKTSLTNDQGFVNQLFNIYGLNGKIKGVVHVYLDSVLLEDVSDKSSFMISDYSIDEAGTYVLSLKALNNGTWEVLDSLIITISLEGGESGGILPRINQPLGSIIGMIIFIFCLLTPFILHASLHLRFEIHPIVYAFTGGMGLAISTILGLFPVWIPLFVLACGIIIIVVYFIRGTQIGTGGGDE